ncbi:MAG: class I SAM-dependent methyltransferase [Patescibacteria group bacterium]
MKQWNQVFKKQGKVFLEPQEEMPKIAVIFKRHKVKRVLDLGCGSGRQLVFLAQRGFSVYGFDIAEEGIKIAKDWLKSEGLETDFKIGSIYKRLPYSDNFFDAAISTHAIHHGKIEDVRKAIGELHRVLKPNGLIFVNLRKRRIKKYDSKNPIIEKHGKQKHTYKMIAERTYMPTEGGEKGLIHYLFNKKQIKKEFRDFKIDKIWISPAGRHYYLLGEAKK